MTTFSTVVLFGVAMVTAQGSQVPAPEIDHVILGINDLDRGIGQFTTLTGMTPKRGGEHPGRGTQNALASLGSRRYLEILAPTASQPRSAPRDPRVEYAELTLAGWALQTRAIGHVVERLRAAGFEAPDPLAGSRRTPEGALLLWKTAVARGPGLELAPFFIEWTAGTIHPSTSSPSGCGLRSLELELPDTTRLQTFFAAVGFKPTLRSGKAPAMRMVLECPKGLVTFSSSRP